MTATYIDPAGKLLGHLGRLAALQEGRTPSPINVEVDLSNRCSLGCEWCHFAFTHTRGPLAGKRAKPEGAIPGGDLMDTSLALRLVEQLAAIGGVSVTWTGGGEPTLHPDFDAIVAHAERRGVAQGIYTHGGHIDAARAALMKRAMTFVYVSLDAADAVAYKRRKGVDRFDHACEGIRLLAAAAGGAKVGAGVLVGEDTDLGRGRDPGEVHRAAWLARRLGADYVQFRPIVSFAIDEPGVPAGGSGWVDAALDAVYQAAAHHPGFVEYDPDRFTMYRGWRGHGYQTCWWSALQAVVTPNGKVWSCVNKREHPAALIGDLAVESFGELWARRPLAKVDGSCRVMCRGHVPNVTLDRVMAVRPHPEFV